jgi:predicted dehydrogenase
LSVPRLDIWSYDAKRSWWEPLRTQRLVAAVEDPLRRQIQHFCRVVRREEAPVIDARDGMATLRVVLAALESARAGKPVRPDAT